MEDLNEKEALFSEYSNTYKEYYGIRPRWIDFDEETIESLQQKLDDLHHYGQIDVLNRIPDPGHEREAQENEDWESYLSSVAVEDDKKFREEEELGTDQPEDTLPKQLGMKKSHLQESLKMIIHQTFKEAAGEDDELSQKLKLYTEYCDMYKKVFGRLPQKKNWMAMSLASLYSLVDGFRGIVENDKEFRAILGRPEQNEDDDSSLDSTLNEKKWIQKAVQPSRKGAFTAKAKKAGRSVAAHAQHILANTKDYDETTVGQAKFAKRAQKGFKK